MPGPPRLWPALDIHLRSLAPSDPQFGDRLAILLDDIDARAVESAEESGRWRVYFADTAARDSAFSLVTATLGNQCDVACLEVEDEGWVYKVQEGLRAVTVGRCTIAPPWDVPPFPPPGRRASDPADPVVLVIEPSMGFGTGHHQSTRVCLLSLQQLDLRGARVIDAGTGSGVLAMAARCFGAADVVAFDNDADSVEAARANVRLNGLDGQLTIEESAVGQQSFDAADVVVANLTAWILRQCGEALAPLVRPGGHLVLGGFTAEQIPLVTDVFPTFTLERQLEEDDWIGLVLRRPS